MRSQSLLFVSLILVIIEISKANAISKPFVRTSGQIVVTDDGLRIPGKGKVLECAAICSRIEGCHCLRISADEMAKCEAFNAKSDVNSLNGTGYIYYSYDRYKDTINGTSIALAKPSSQSSEFISNGIRYTADRANDGKRNTVSFDAPYLSQTNDNPADPHPWWMVDLKAEYLITGVTILNRRHMAERLHDLEIRVGNNQITNSFSKKVFDKNPLCGQMVGTGIPDAGSKTFICEPCPLAGRYLTIQIVRNCSACSQPSPNILTLAEVDVYGFIANSIE